MFVQIKKRWGDERKSEYATHSDFCAIFVEHVQRLYLLALLLTGDHPTAEQCFVTAFELCAQGSSVFKDLATSWSKRSVIKSAIRIAPPIPSSESSLHLGNHSEQSVASGASLKSVHELPPFDRFVFVMSVLERYSDRECSALLDCALSDVVAARVKAVQQLSITPEKYSTGPSAGDSVGMPNADWLECGEFVHRITNHLS